MIEKKPYITKKIIMLEIISLIIVVISLIIAIVGMILIDGEMNVHYTITGVSDAKGGSATLLVMPISMLCTIALVIFCMHVPKDKYKNLPSSKTEKGKYLMNYHSSLMCAWIDILIAMMSLLNTIASIVQNGVFVFWSVIAPTIIVCILVLYFMILVFKDAKY